MELPYEKKPFFSVAEEGASAFYDSLLDQPGRLIGRYKLLAIIGEGGHGIVYLAEQQEPIKRKVALKVVKPGISSKEILARFEVERQALAFLNHPSIPHVFDAGSTVSGRPYFVMEYVDGVPITEYCDQYKLCVEDRLKLFVQVCQAIHHAHQNGIIHRDIKPSNILVRLHDGRAVPKLIDFGVARAVSQPLSDWPRYTAPGQLVGTPEYMSPEQVEMNNQDIDSRSDIYSLGVVLYELLTGALPFDPKTLRKGGFYHLQQVICKQEPLSPSRRVSAFAAAEGNLAECRCIELQTLVKMLRNELEWIPLKAMRKERARRYQSASELAKDIDNYLNGTALIAGPESTVYRMKKLVRKRLRSAVVGAAFAILVVSHIVSSMSYFKAEASRVKADRARTAEVRHRRLAEVERDRAIYAEQQLKKQLMELLKQQHHWQIKGVGFEDALGNPEDNYKTAVQQLPFTFNYTDNTQALFSGGE